MDEPKNPTPVKQRKKAPSRGGVRPNSGGAREGAGRPRFHVANGEDRKRLADIARQHTDAAIEVILSVMGDEKNPADARLRAACALLDRGYGRPTEMVDVNADLSVTVRMAERLRAAKERAENS